MHGKQYRNDIMHHSVFIMGSWIVFNFSGCASFGFLLSHMQCLHFPMALWYAGCRRSLGVLRGHSSFQKICVTSFPTLWVLCVSYRFTIMSISIFASLRQLPLPLSVIFVAFLCIITAIDHSWTSYFLDLLGSPSKAVLALTMLSGAALGALVLSVPAV